MSATQEKYRKRLEHFRWNNTILKEMIEKDSEYFDKLDFFENYITSLKSQARMVRLKGDGEDEQLLTELLSEIYNFIYNDCKQTYAPLFHAIGKDSLQGTFSFVVLCTFLHTTTRIEGESYSTFLYKHDPLKYYDHESPNYCAQVQLASVTDRFRKTRYRKLSQGKVFVPGAKWAAVPKDLEHELKFRFVIESAELDLYDTYKRFGNLYNDIIKAVEHSERETYETDLLNAQKKFMSKLGKIEYSKYLRLQKQIISHINDDKEYYGLNLYRLEQTMMPYRTTNDVHRLLSSQTDSRAEAAYLLRTAYLKDIPFPSIYEKLLFSPVDANAVETYANMFSLLIQNVSFIGCLILDALIAENFLDDNWADLFRCMTNKLAKSMLYAPDKINFDAPEGPAQEKFEKLLCFPVNLMVYNETKSPIYFPMNQFQTSV